MFINFEYIKFKNFRSYPATETKFEFKPGLNSIIGANGGGKSTITTEAISYCLYGKPYSKVNLSDLVNRVNKKKLWTECAFNIGKDRYVIQRGMKPNILSVTKNGEDFELLSSKSLNQDEIDKILGIDYKMFKNIISLSVNYNKPFFELSKQDKREILENIFNVNIFGDMLKVLKPKISKLKVDIDIDTNKCNELKESYQTQKSYVEELEQSKNNFETSKKNDIADLEHSINDNAQKIEQCEKDISELEKSIKVEDDAMQEKIVLLKKSLEEDKKDIQDQIEKLKAEYELHRVNYQRSIDNCKSEIKEIEKTYEASKKAKTDQLTQLKESNGDKIDKLRKKINNADKVLTEKKKEIESKIDSIGKIDFSHEEKLLDGYKAKKIGFESDKRSCSKKIDFFNKNDVCPECDEQLDEAKKKDKIQEYTNKIEECEKEIENLDSMIVKTKRVIDHKKDQKEKKNDLQQEIVKYESMVEKKKSEFKTQITEIENSKEIYIIEKEIGELERKYERETTELKNEQQKAQTLLDNSDESLQTKIEIVKNKSKSSDLQQQINTIEQRSKQKELHGKIEFKNQSIVAYKESTERSLKKLDEVKKKVFDIDIEKVKKTMEEKKDQYQESKNVLDNNLKMYDNYNVVKEILGDNGLKSYFYRKLIPILNQKINQYTNQLNLPVTIEFTNDIDVNISTFNGRDSGLNYNTFSGGERKTIDMSILFAFIDVSKTITNWGCNILILDEIGDSGLDSERMEQLVKLIKEMVDKAKNFCVYLISHKAIEQSYFDNTINITKRGQFSHIELGD